MICPRAASKFAMLAPMVSLPIFFQCLLVVRVAILPFLFLATIVVVGTTIRTTIRLLLFVWTVLLEMTIFPTIVALDLGNVFLAQL